MKIVSITQHNQLQHESAEACATFDTTTLLALHASILVRPQELDAYLLPAVVWELRKREVIYPMSDATELRLRSLKLVRDYIRKRAIKKKDRRENPPV